MKIIIIGSGIAELEKQASSAMINDDHQALDSFLTALPQSNIVTAYKDLIPLVDKKSCITIAQSISANVKHYN